MNIAGVPTAHWAGVLRCEDKSGSLICPFVDDIDRVMNAQLVQTLSYSHELQASFPHLSFNFVGNTGIGMSRMLSTAQTFNLLKLPWHQV